MWVCCMSDFPANFPVNLNHSAVAMPRYCRKLVSALDEKDSLHHSGVFLGSDIS